MCVIADEAGPESLAGIMGGEATGCSKTTTDVLIESALWEPLNIAQTGRKLGINSDARYRFERGVDPAFMLPGLELATQMVLDLCGGTPSEITVAGDPQVPELIIDFPLSRAQAPRRHRGAVCRRCAACSAGSASSSPARTRTSRSRCRRGGRTCTARPTSSRRSSASSASIACRRRRSTAATMRASRCSRRQMRTRKAKRALAARGMVEAVTWSFISKPQAELFGGGKAELALANPIAADLSDMRPSLIPGLVAARRRTPTAASPTRRCSRSARFSRATSRRSSSPLRRACAARSPKRQVRPPLAGSRRGRCIRCQGRRARGAGRRRRAGRGAAGGARRSRPPRC